MKFLRKKKFEEVRESSTTSGLNKSFGAFDLVMFGLGAIIGVGVFVVTGQVAAEYSGPAVTLSYAIAGIICIFAAFAYTELAAMLPTSGSVYTYSYVALGEIFAWLIGSVIILELGFGAGVVAKGWSGYMQGLLASGGIKLPYALTHTPGDGGIINLPALLISLFIGFILYLGTKDSKKLNTLLVFVKMAAIFVFVITAAPHFKISNWENFMPFGFQNVLAGSSLLFLGFTGFGTIATAAEECKNPKRDLMIGIIGSLVLAIIVYVLIGGLLTGIVPFSELNNAHPLAHALNLNGSNIGSAIVATGAICGMTTVLMMQIFGLSRIFYVVARDGLLPKSFAKLHPKYDTPYVTIIIFSLMVGILAAFCPMQALNQMTNMGAIIDYIAVAFIVMLFRFTLPKANRPFKCPAIFIVAPIALIACTGLLYKLMFAQDGNAGYLIMYWFAGIFGLYIIKSLIFKDNAGDVK